MRREQNKQTLKLRLLALVLALALVWYSLNPAPRPISLQKRKVEPPDEQKRNAEPQSMPATLPAAFQPSVENAKALLSDEDDFEWPEFIDG